MFIITHDLEAALICDKAAILREGRLLEFDTPQNLISTLPSEGLIARFTIENLNEGMIEFIKNFPSIRRIIRVGNEAIEVLMGDFEENLPKLIQYMIENNIKVNSMSKDMATFRRYFQIRIQMEEENEKSLEKGKVIKK